MSVMSPRSILIGNLAKLEPKDQNFAASLLRFPNPSEKQLYWIKKLADKLTGTQVVPVKVSNVSALIKFIGRARGKLIHPKIVFNIATSIGPQSIRISIAGVRSKHPGSVNVANYTTRDWYGRIQIGGDWEPSPSLEDKLSYEILVGLQEFAKDPVKSAASYGHLTGNCCFCMLPLTDERSTSVGYGPVCAGNYGLPWGGKE